jgi:hypothetical protein
MLEKIKNFFKKKVGKLPNKVTPSSTLAGPIEHDLSHARDNRCVPIAHELVKLLANMEKMPVGTHVNEKEKPMRSVYLPVVQDFLKLLIDKDVKIVEITYIFSLVQQALEFVSTTIDETMNQQMNRVTELVYGLKQNDSDEITVKNLNEVVMRKGEIEKVWRTILDSEVKIKDN